MVLTSALACLHIDWGFIRLNVTSADQFSPHCRDHRDQQLADFQNPAVQRCAADFQVEVQIREPVCEGFVARRTASQPSNADSTVATGADLLFYFSYQKSQTGPTPKALDFSLSAVHRSREAKKQIGLSAWTR